MRETERSAKIIEHWRKSNFVINVHGGAYQQAGLPDCCVITNGFHIWVEFKDSKTKLTTLQNAIHEKMRKSGAKVFVVRFDSESEWIIDDRLLIKFRTMKEGSELLLKTLMELSNVPLQSSPIQGYT